MDGSQVQNELKRIEESKAESISALRKKFRISNLLRNVVQGLWFAVLHRAVEIHSIEDNRTSAVRNLYDHLYAGREISVYKKHNERKIRNRDIMKQMSKRLRCGRTSWLILSSEEPSRIATIDLSSPVSREATENILKRSDGHRNSPCDAKTIQRVLNFLESIVERTRSLYDYLHQALKDVRQSLSKPVHDISYEAAFNKNTYLQHTIQYDSPIFISVQCGDIAETLALLQSRKASVYDVDPYGLGLLYVGNVQNLYRNVAYTREKYAAYYCWRSLGAAKAIEMCRMLVSIGAILDVQDEIGHAPLETMIDSAFIQAYKDKCTSSLIAVGMICNESSQELIVDFQKRSGFTPLHYTLCNIAWPLPPLSIYLQDLQDNGNIYDIIDLPDLYGRSCLAWAVEYGMADEAKILLDFGANPLQFRKSSRSSLPLLHLAVAGPPPQTDSGLFKVVQILLAAGIDINARDEEGWTAWHVAASWRSYNLLCEMWHSYVVSIDLDAITRDGATASDLSQDSEFSVTLSTLLGLII